MRRPLAVLALALLSACAGVEDRPGVAPEELYREAQAAVEGAEFERAQRILDRVRDEFPFSRVAVDAELLAADSSFQQEKYVEAAAAYRSFEELHPTHPKVPYALFQRALAHEALSQPEDRDQTGTRSAVEAFQRFLYAYPDDPRASDARARLAAARERLARHELYVARYYVRQEKYEAALARLETLRRDYPDAPVQEEAGALVREIEEKRAAGR